MASKKTQSVKKAAPKAKAPAKTKAAPKGPKVAAKPTGPRHPKARVAAAAGSKAELAKTLASALAHGDQDAGSIETKLKTASNAQLLRLSRATQTLKDRFGSREKLIAAIGAARNKSKDQDYLTKLNTYSLHQLLDLAPKRAAAAAK
jgi:hypothetical protein